MDFQRLRMSFNREESSNMDRTKKAEEADITAPVDYSKMIELRAQEVFDAMSSRVDANDMQRLHEAFEMARDAHASQKRKTGEPYIFHPIAVALIAAQEIKLDVNAVIACFLHDVVEDTPHTVEDVAKRFGQDVAFLVRVVTKQKKEKYELSKQLDNFKQMLSAMQKDIRPILIKLADRLHNMRTLESMRTDKQMKTAGETDYFYAPLATRLGLYEVKTELENLSLRFRCPHEYKDLVDKIETDRKLNSRQLDKFVENIHTVLSNHGINCRVFYSFRHPYSLWRKMQKYNEDFFHLKYRHFIDIVFESSPGVDEKTETLRIYSILTDHFKEKPGGISNYIDTPKENGYQSFHFKLLSDNGRWEEVHISSERMVINSRLGILSEYSTTDVDRWITKFRSALKEIYSRAKTSSDFFENLMASFYNDDLTVYTPDGRPVVMPQRSTVLDFAYEIHTYIGNHAKYARINGRLASIFTPLHRGDIVEVFTDQNDVPKREWLDHTVSYKARKAINTYLSSLPKLPYDRCPHCNPMPSAEVIGYKEQDGSITVHKRDCPVVIRLASQWGDNIVDVDFVPNDTLYPVTIKITCVDRFHMIIDVIECISNKLGLSIGSINTSTQESIATIILTLGVHSYDELQEIMGHIRQIPDVDEVNVE